MGLISFTANYTDRSNDSGYQFEFHCDKCGNGFLSTFQPSKIGIAGGLLRAAGGFFGGGLGRLASASGHIKDALHGPAWDAAFRVADSEDAKDLTMARLGRELNTDPSSVYRHFASKDQLLAAMADVLLEETYAAYVEGDEPVENVRRMAWALRRTYLRRPSLARLITLRSNDGAAARACMAALRQSLAALGYDEEQTGLLARVVAEVTLSHIAMTADELAQPAGRQRADLELAASSYAIPTRRLEVSDRDLTESVLADGEQVFGAALELLLEALAARAAAQQPTSKAAPKTAAKAKAAPLAS